LDWNFTALHYISVEDSRSKYPVLSSPNLAISLVWAHYPPGAILPRQTTFFLFLHILNLFPLQPSCEPSA